jgi:hypothetical protein
MGLNVRKAETPAIHSLDDANCDALLQEADTILTTIKPDAILTGLSGPGAGIDEALIARATDIPCYTLQDYWGDVNHLFEKIADCYFTLDDTAAKLTRQRFGAESCVAGSPKHAAYARLNLQSLRHDKRLHLDLTTEHCLIGLFGQPIKPVDDYLLLIDQFADAVADWPPRKSILYRAHPSDSASTAQQVMQILHDKGLSPILDSGSDLTSILCSCDMVASAYSSCNLDNIFLNYYSSQPLGISVYLFLNESIADLHFSQTGLKRPPVVDLEFAALSDSTKSMHEILQQQENKRTAYWQRIRDDLPDPRHATTIILEKVLSDLN